MGKNNNGKQRSSKEALAKIPSASYGQDQLDKNPKLRFIAEEDLLSLEDFDSQSSRISNSESEVKALTDLQLRDNSEEHLKVKYNTFLNEVEEVEYFDTVPEKPSFSESYLPSHSQPPQADSQKDGLEALYYVYRILHAILNLMIIMFLILTLYGFVWVVWNDITRLIREHELGIGREIARCQEEYSRYGCGPQLEIPGLQAYCEKLDTCRSEDLESLPLAAISVKALASILNGFFNELSYKSMIFFVAFMFVWLCASAMLSWLLRPQPPQATPPPPLIHQTPTIKTPSRRVRRYSYQPSPQPRARRQFRPSHQADPIYSDYEGTEFDI